MLLALLPLNAGKRGFLLQTPRLLKSEKNAEIRADVERVLVYRRLTYGENGCPIAVFTDKITRDHVWIDELLTEMFPACALDPHRKPAVCQDIIHREWAFTRVIPKTHPDREYAHSDIKFIFGRFT